MNERKSPMTADFCVDVANCLIEIRKVSLSYCARASNNMKVSRNGGRVRSDSVTMGEKQYVSGSRKLDIGLWSLLRETFRCVFYAHDVREKLIKRYFVVEALCDGFHIDES